MMLLRPAAVVMQKQREEAEQCKRIIASCFQQLFAISGLLADDRLKDMTRYAVLRKQIEVQAKLDRIKERQQIKAEYDAAMANREILHRFREGRRLLKEAEEESLALELEEQELDRKWKAKIQRATELRNKKIVSLVQLSKDIADTLAVSSYPPIVPNSMAMPQRKGPPIALQLASDFLSNICEEPKAADPSSTTDTEGNTNNNDASLRSILVTNRVLVCHSKTSGTPSPTKQVHFGP
ncbi:hypothetical protein KR222_000695, partial [Zaprionus bogoriensis]